MTSQLTQVGKKIRTTFEATHFGLLYGPVTRPSTGGVMALKLGSGFQLLLELQPRIGSRLGEARDGKVNDRRQE